MKRLTALITTLTVIGVVGASPALAGSQNKIPYTTQPYPTAVDSNNNPTDFWTCTGFRLVAGSAVQDHFRCTVTDQTYTGTFTESTTWPCGCNGWQSDYDAKMATSFLIRVSSNGTVVGTAKY